MEVATSHASYRGMQGPHCDGVLRLVTNRLDLPAELVAEIYRLRWVIEQPQRTRGLHQITEVIRTGAATALSASGVRCCAVEAFLDVPSGGVARALSPALLASAARMARAQPGSRERRAGCPKRTSGERARATPTHALVGYHAEAVGKPLARLAEPAVPNRIAIVAFAHSMLTALRHPWLRWSATPATGHRAAPHVGR